MKYFFVIILTLLCLDLIAQDTVRWTNRKFSEEDLNKFRFNGGTIACITSTEPDPYRGYLDCLHISDLNMDMNVNEVEKLYGKPYQVINNDNSQSRIYLLPTDGDIYPYLVVTYAQGKIDAIQLTGHGTTKDINFSSIRLGDTDEFVKEILGPPYETFNVDEINGIKWSYNPFPISIEFINREVYSIRIFKNMK